MVAIDEIAELIADRQPHLARSAIATIVDLGKHRLRRSVGHLQRRVEIAIARRAFYRDADLPHRMGIGQFHRARQFAAVRRVLRLQHRHARTYICCIEMLIALDEYLVDTVGNDLEIDDTSCRSLRRDDDLVKCIAATVQQLFERLGCGLQTEKALLLAEVGRQERLQLGGRQRIVAVDANLSDVEVRFRGLQSWRDQADRDGNQPVHDY